MHKKQNNLITILVLHKSVEFFLYLYLAGIWTILITKHNKIFSTTSTFIITTIYLLWISNK
jgi:hypothetical protein